MTKYDDEAGHTIENAHEGNHLTGDFPNAANASDDHDPYSRSKDHTHQDQKQRIVAFESAEDEVAKEAQADQQRKDAKKHQRVRTINLGGHGTIWIRPVLQKGEREGQGGFRVEAYSVGSMARMVVTASFFSSALSWSYVLSSISAFILAISNSLRPAISTRLRAASIS